MIAMPTPPAVETAVCGCRQADVTAGLHPEADCITQYLIAIAEADLPADPDPHRLRFHTAQAHSQSNPLPGLHRIIPPRGILASVATDELPDDGFWQLQTDGYVVPISLDTYRAHVRRCHSQSCGQCQECRELAAFVESRKRAHERLDEAVDKVQAAAQQALRLLAEVGAGSADWDEDLGYTDTQDLKRDLEEAERRARAAKRITALHLATLPNAGGEQA